MEINMSSLGLHMFEYLAWQWSGSTACKTPYPVNQTALCWEIYETCSSVATLAQTVEGRMTSRIHTLARVQKTRRGLCQKDIAYHSYCIVVLNTQYLSVKQTQFYRIQTQVCKTSEVDPAEGFATWSEQHLLSPIWKTQNAKLFAQKINAEDHAWIFKKCDSAK